jgi:hypothetical protein
MRRKSQRTFAMLASAVLAATSLALSVGVAEAEAAALPAPCQVFGDTTWNVAATSVCWSYEPGWNHRAKITCVYNGQKRTFYGPWASTLSESTATCAQGEDWLWGFGIEQGRFD